MDQLEQWIQKELQILAGWMVRFAAAEVHRKQANHYTERGRKELVALVCPIVRNPVGWIYGFSDFGLSMGLPDVSPKWIIQKIHSCS
jgi:hypothetical protein